MNRNEVVVHDMNDSRVILEIKKWKDEKEQKSGRTLKSGQRNKSWRVVPGWRV